MAKKPINVHEHVFFSQFRVGTYLLYVSINWKLVF